MRYLAVLLLLAGCATEGDRYVCIGEGYFTGDRVNDPKSGRTGTVERVEGKSVFCPLTNFPKRAFVRFDEDGRKNERVYEAK